MVDPNTLSLPELFRSLTDHGMLEPLVGLALREDLNEVGDVTTRSVIPQGTWASAAVRSREVGVLAGGELISRLLEIAGVRGSLEFDAEIPDGRAVVPADVLGRLHGSLAAMLRLERLVLNFLGRLSGVATLTRRYVDAVEGTDAVITDTRKTTPGLRVLEKYAVRCGGGTLHRLGLFDAALYKDNHLAYLPPADLARGLAAAATKARRDADLRFVEVEVDTLEQFEAILAVGAGTFDVILLDNMPPEDLREAVRLRDERAPEIQLEASGGVTLRTVRAIAETGVDRIAVGEVTHSAPALDVGLDMEVT